PPSTTAGSPSPACSPPTSTPRRPATPPPATTPRPSVPRWPPGCGARDGPRARGRVHPRARRRRPALAPVANSAAYLAPHLVAGTDVLDVGCGPGTITAEIAGLVAPGSVLGLDRSADAVAVAARDHGAPNPAFAIGDVHALDQPD